MKGAARHILHFITEKLSSLSLKRIVLVPAFQLLRNKPVNLIPEEEKYFVREFSRNLPAVTKSTVKNARLLTTEGLVIKGFHVISESLLDESVRNWYGPSYITKAYKNAINLPPVKYLYVYNHYGVGYGHWLADVLPRLLVIKEQLPEYKILLPDNYNTFHIDSLAPFGITREQVMYLQQDQVYKVPDLTLISHVGSSCNTKDEILQELREMYLDFYVGKHRKAPFRKLYVSRAGVTNRKVINNDDVEKLLIENGYEILHPQNYNFNEQVQLFSECKTMIGLTGSGLTNMLFMPAGGNIIEFKMEGDFTNLHYFSMTSAMELDYYYLLCKTRGNDRFTADFLVDLEKLEAILLELSNPII